MKSKARKAAVRAGNEATRLEQEIRALPKPTNPKLATAKWDLVVALARARGESVNATKKYLWPKKTALEEPYGE